VGVGVGVGVFRGVGGLNKVGTRYSSLKLIGQLLCGRSGGL
jgi:hypothetical protein